MIDDEVSRKFVAISHTEHRGPEVAKIVLAPDYMNVGELVGQGPAPDVESAAGTSSTGEPGIIIQTAETGEPEIQT